MIQRQILLKSGLSCQVHWLTVQALPIVWCSSCDALTAACARFRSAWTSPETHPPFRRAVCSVTAGLLEGFPEVYQSCRLSYFRFAGGFAWRLHYGCCYCRSSGVRGRSRCWLHPNFATHPTVVQVPWFWSHKKTSSLAECQCIYLSFKPRQLFFELLIFTCVVGRCLCPLIHPWQCSVHGYHRYYSIQIPNDHRQMAIPYNHRPRNHNFMD